MKEIKIFASCHNHSNFSDAEYSPERLVEIAHSLGHGGIIITDHDTVSATYFANKAARRVGMKTLLGCEFSTYNHGVGVHLLGFDFNPDNRKMKELLEYGSSVQTARSELMFKWGLERGTLREGVTWQDVRDAYPYNDYLCNNQVFEVYKARGIYSAEEYDELFMKPNFSHSLGLEEKITEITGRSYKNVNTADVVKIIIEAGGVPVIAHPHGHIKYVNEYLDMGVMGFETRFPSVTDEEHDFFEALCDERGLYKMGGSDHSGILGGLTHLGDAYACPENRSGISEENFMTLYERRLG